MKRWTVGDVMTTDVVSVREETPYRDITEQLAQHKISAAPVVDSARRVVGVVSEADLLYKLAHAGEDQGKPLFAWPSRRVARVKSQGDKAKQLMTAPPVTIGADATLAAAAKLMEDRKVKRLPVVDGDDRLVGIVSRSDLLRMYLRPDPQIRDEITDGVLRHTLWVDPLSIEVDVIDGVVALRGRVDRRTTATLIAQLAGIVPGVIEVRDELSWDFDDTVTATSAGYYSTHPRP